MSAYGFNLLDPPDDDFCPHCQDYVPASHDVNACERCEHLCELESAIITLEDASSHLAKGQPLRVAEWDQDTREASRIINERWLLLSRMMAKAEA